MPTSRTWTHRPDICLPNHQQQNWDLNTNLPDTSAQIFSLHHTNLTEGSSRAVINYLNLQSLEWQSQIFMVGPFLFTVDKKKERKKPEEIKRDFSLMGISLSPPWHSGIDHWSAINEAYNVKKGNGFCVRLVLCIYVTKTLMSVKFLPLNYIVEIMIGFFFSLRSLFLHSYVNTCQHVEFFSFNKLN